MSKTFDLILELVKRKDVKISDHGYNELMEDGIFVTEVIESFETAVVLEDYPEYSKGPCVLLMQKDSHGDPIHTVWGIPRGAFSPAVLITAYRPDPKRWSDDFMRRKQ